MPPPSQQYLLPTWQSRNSMNSSSGVWDDAPFSNVSLVHLSFNIPWSFGTDHIFQMRTHLLWLQAPGSPRHPWVHWALLITWFISPSPFCSQKISCGLTAARLWEDLCIYLSPYWQTWSRTWKDTGYCNKNSESIQEINIFYQTI